MKCPKCSCGEILKVEKAIVYTKYSIDDDFEQTSQEAEQDWENEYFDHYECDGCGTLWSDRSEIINDIIN